MEDTYAVMEYELTSIFIWAYFGRWLRDNERQTGIILVLTVDH